MTPTLSDIEDALRDKDIDALRPARELSRDIAILVALDDYRRAVRDWAEHYLEQREVPLRHERDRWAEQRDAALQDAAELSRSIGVDPPGTSRKDLEAAWPDVLDVVARDRRERELLGPTDQERRQGEMARRGRVAEDTPPDVVPEIAKAIRELMETADQYHKDVVRLNQQIETLTAEDVDEQWVGWMLHFPAGTVPRQGEDARPQLDLRLLDAAIELGVLNNDRI